MTDEAGAFRIEPSQDVEAALAVDAAAGWSIPPPEVARRVAASATHLLARDAATGAPVGRAGCAVFPLAAQQGTLAWVNQMVVAPAWRGRGVGRALLRRALAEADAAGARAVCLYATDAGRPLYEKEGFRALATSTAWSRPAPREAAAPSPRHSVHPISLSEAMEVGQYDAPRYGARRLPWLMALQHAFPWQALMARERATGEVSGFVLRSERRVGPLVADDDEAAAALLAAAEVAGAPPALAALDDHAGARRVLEAAGYAPTGPRTTLMLRGDALPPRREETLYALGAWSFG